MMLWKNSWMKIRRLQIDKGGLSMEGERHTFVITLEEDVAEFLDVKNKSASELNVYINKVLLKKQEQSKGKAAQSTATR